MDTINIGVQNKFMKLWYKRNKTTLQDTSIKNHTKIVSNDEPLMVDNQTQTSNQVLEKQVESKEVEAKNVIGTNTSDEESMVEVILEDKTPQ